MISEDNIYPIELSLLINGKQVKAEEHRAVINPCTEQQVAEVPCGSLQHLQQAVVAAKAALPAWSNNLEARQQTLKQIAQVITENQDRLATLLSLETGLAFANARDEVGMAAYFFKYRSRCVPAIDVIHDDDAQKVQVVRKPIGVVGAIIPWNAPMMIASEKIATAFSAGNTVVLKTSPLAPMALLLLGGLLAEIVPAGVLNILCGSDELGKAMVAHADIGMISFTGSTSVGRAIMASGGATLKRLSLELGGNDAAIVLADANPQKVASRIFWGAFYRSGQICAAIKRVYVPAAMYDDFVQAMVQMANKIQPMDAFAEGALMGPLSNAEQYQKVVSLIARTQAAGGHLVAGGIPEKNKGYFIPPTIFTGVDANNPLVVEEQFGPVLPILPYHGVEQAITEANATDFGLGASVWGADLHSAEAVANQLQAGSVWINRHGIVMPDIPFGGFKGSGIGRANGNIGLDSYSELQTISMAKPK